MQEALATGDFLIVLKANIDSLASVYSNTIKVKLFKVEIQLEDRDVSNEVNRILGTILESTEMEFFCCQNLLVLRVVSIFRMT